MISSVTWGRSLQTDCVAAVTAAQTAFRSNTGNRQVDHPMNIYSLRDCHAGCEEKANRRASPSTHRTPYGRVHHGVPNVRSSPRVHGSGHPSPPRLAPGRCGLHGGTRRFTRRLRRVVHRSSGGHRLVPPSEPLPQGGDGCPAPFPRVAVRPFRTPFRDRRQEMCGQMRHTILADRR